MWLWSKLSGKQWQDAWEERFYGNPNTVISEIAGGKTLRVEVYSETRENAEKIKNQFGGSIRELKQQNWVAMSAAKNKPLKIRDSLLISSSEDEEELATLLAQNPYRNLIRVPAEMAFGTGDHATTSTCLRFLVDVAKKRATAWEMLDLGCGTSILAIAAKKLGATLCEAHDFDRQAIIVSEKNILLNEVDGINVHQQDVLTWQPQQQWDVVVANMFSSILQQAFPTIVKVMKADADLIISGILADQWEETKQAAELAGISFSRMQKKGKWVTAQGTKR